MVRVTDIQCGFLDLSDSLHVSENDFQEFTRRYTPKHGDIVFSRVGSYGNASYVNSDTPSCLGQNTAVICPRINGRFLHLFLQSAVARNQIEQLAVGSTQKTISLKSISSLNIPIPPAAELEFIAHILGTLDDKIELNRRMNATLEAMARALFQSWFVDFDPVRAKQQGRPPASLDPATAAFFPAEFEPSELGEIPKGWKAGTLGEVAINLRRGVEADELDRTAAYIGLEHMPRRSIALTAWGTAEEPESNKSAFRRNEILFGKLRPYFHKVGVAPVDGVCSTDILVISTTSSQWFGFVLGHCSSDSLVAHTDAMSTGTKMPQANWKDIAGYSVVLPPIELAATFTRAVRPLVERVCANIHESRTLATLRDTLLPTLLSGKISAKHDMMFTESRL